MPGTLMATINGSDPSFRCPKLLRRLARSWDAPELAGNDWSRILVFHCAAQADGSQRSIAEIAEQRSGDPFDAIDDLLLAEIDRLHEVMVLALTYREPDLRLAFEHPDCMIGSDATALAPDGPLAHTSFHGAYTWAGWFYRHFVRDQKMITP